MAELKGSSQVAYEKLIKCGFNSKRCLRALVASGMVGAREAGEWLSAHIDDPELDNPTARDYYIFLCPKDDLFNAIIDYWDHCKSEIGWNLAHEYPPHITLIQQFQIPDNKITDLLELIELRLTYLSKELSTLQMAPDLEMLSNCDPLETKKNFLGYQAIGQAKVVLDKLSSSLLKDLDDCQFIFY